MDNFSVNYLAVLLSSIVAFAIGAVWYSPALFFKPWAASLGKTEEELKKGASPLSYVITFLAWFVAVYVLARIFWFFGVDNIGTGLRVTFLCWLGFGAAPSLIHILFEGKKYLLWIINWGYILVGLAVSSLLLTIW
jgi:hypothetical protein